MASVAEISKRNLEDWTRDRDFLEDAIIKDRAANPILNRNIKQWMEEYESRHVPMERMDMALTIMAHDRKKAKELRLTVSVSRSQNMLRRLI